jgi:hypothetical protein
LSLRIAIVLFAAISSTDLVYAEEMHSSFSTQEAPSGAVLTLSPCTGEEVSECVAHTLTCQKPSWDGFKLAIIQGKIDELASKLVIGTDGQVAGALVLGGGKVKVNLPINSIGFGRNELDGGWVMEVGFDDLEGTLDSISAKNAEQAYIELGSSKFILSPENGDGAKLVKFRNACLKLKG